MLSKVKNDPKIKVRAVSKSHFIGGQVLQVLRDIEFHALEGEFVSIVGPSGCGKSTLLNIIAGLEEPTKGDIYLNGKRPHERLGAIGYMPQKDLLFPWRTIMENAILGLELKHVSKKTARAAASQLMSLFGLEGFDNEYPYALSGGMRQRVSFLRTVLADQEVFLLDEPLSALDALNRLQIQEWLQEMWQSLGKTIVLVTHDVDEALFLSDRIYVMSSRPGNMKMVLPIPLPRPRTIEMVTNSAFVSLKAEILHSIREEPMSPMQEKVLA